jgi:hypothetical protein
MLPALVAVALVSHQTPDLAQKITFETRAVPIYRLFKQLTAKTGVELAADAETSRQIAIVSIKDVGLKSLMDKLAATFNAEWRQEQSAYVLTHTPALKQKEQQALSQTRKELLQKALEPIFKSLKPAFNQQEADSLLARLQELKRRQTENPADPEPQRLYQQEQNRGVLNRALIKLVQTIPVEELAAIPTGARVIFTDRPTKMQRPFGPSSKQVLEELRRDYQLWTDTLKKAELPRDNESMVSDPLVQSWPLPSPDKKVYVTATGTDLEWRAFNLEIGEGHARRVLSQLTVSGVGRDLYETAQSGALNKADIIPLSRDSELFVSLLKQWRNRALPGKAFAKGGPAEHFLDPVAYEPLSLLPSDGLLAEAKAEGKNFVAWVPDDLLMLVSSQAMERPLTRTAFLTVIRHPDRGIDLQSASDWLVGKPHNPAGTRARYTNREAVRDVLLAWRQKGRITLVDYAKYAAACDHGPYSGFGSIFITLADPMFPALSDMSSWSVLQFYGSLTDQQRLSLDRGATIPFNTLSPRQKRFATALTYAGEINNIKTLEPHSGEIVHPRQEPTEALPNGLPADGFVALSLMKAPTIIVFSSSVDGEIRPYRTSAEYNLAHMIHRESRGGTPGPYDEPKAAGYQLGEHSIIRLRLVYGEKLWNEYGMTESAPIGPPKPVQYAGLPADVRKRVDEQLKRIVERDTTRPSGGSKPPPMR